MFNSKTVSELDYIALSCALPHSSVNRTMLASKTFVKKTKKGAVVKVVREHYLRDDVWCGVRGCGVCKQQDPPLEGCPVVNSDLCPTPHYLLPDTNVVLHQIDFLEDVSITNVIILQIVLQEVRGKIEVDEIASRHT